MTKRTNQNPTNSPLVDEYVHRYGEKDHQPQSITTGWSPKYMTCRVCGEAVIPAWIAKAQAAEKVQ